MAWTEKTTVKGKTRYYSRYRSPDGRKQRLPDTYPTKIAAKQAAIEAESRAQSLRQEPDSSKITWGEWAEQWWSRRDVDASTRDRDQSRYTKHLEPRWSDTALTDITRGRIQAWVHSLSEDSDLSASTAQKCFFLLSASLKAAVIADLLPSNPCVGVTLPRTNDSDIRYLTEDEFVRVCACLNEPWRTFVRVLVGTGLRFSELAGLHWHRVDLDAGIAEIRDTCDGSKRWIEPRTKATSNGSRSRSIPLMDWVVDDLRRHAARSTHTGRCETPHLVRLGTPGSDPVTKPCGAESGLVFTGRDGGAVNYFSFRRGQFVPALEQAGVLDVQIKDLRHTFASWMLHHGQTIFSVRDLLGHKSVTTTERYYGNLDRTQWSSVRAAFTDPEHVSSEKDGAKFAPDFAPEDQMISDSKIVDLDRFRRSR